MNEAIQVCDLHYTYPDAESEREHIVFDGLNLSIEAGSFVAVLGHNGCGKSTLAKHFNAILLPAGGRVTVYGMDTKDEALLLAIRQAVGMVFQNPDNQIVSLRRMSPLRRRISACRARRSGGAWTRC